MTEVNIAIATNPRTGRITLIEVNPPTVPMPQGARDETIHFKLASKDYSFVSNPEEAIKIHNQNNQFKDFETVKPGKQVSVVDKNTEKGEFKYTIRVEDKDGDTMDIDPLIKNNP